MVARIQTAAFSGVEVLGVDVQAHLALLVALGKVDATAAAQWIVVGELGLDGTIAPVSGVLPVTIDRQKPAPFEARPNVPNLMDVKGQKTVKRALEVAAADGHKILMIGPPGSGKSMLAARLPGLLPPLEPAEAMSVSMVHSIAGTLRHPSFRDPHHSASVPALVGGGTEAKPGEVSLAH